MAGGADGATAVTPTRHRFGAAGDAPSPGRGGYSSNESMQGKICYQVEYYFSPENLCRPDKFLLGNMFYDEGRITFDLKKLAEFRKVKELTSDFELILESMRKSELLDVDESGERVLIVPRYIKPVPRSTLALREAPVSASEDQIREVIAGAPEPVAVRCVAPGSWHVGFASEDDVKAAFQVVSGRSYPAGEPVTAKIKSEGIKFVREQDEQKRLRMEAAQRASNKKCEKLLYLPIAMRPLLVGRGGQNIKRLQEQYPSLEVDTYHDDFNVKLKADDMDTLDRAAEAISLFFQPPDQQQQQSPQPAPPLATLPTAGPVTMAAPLAPGVPMTQLPTAGLLNNGGVGTALPLPAGQVGGGGSVVVLQQSGGMPAAQLQPPPHQQQLVMQQLQQLRFQQQLQQQQQQQQLALQQQVLQQQQLNALPQSQLMQQAGMQRLQPGLPQTQQQQTLAFLQQQQHAMRQQQQLQQLQAQQQQQQQLQQQQALQAAAAGLPAAALQPQAGVLSPAAGAAAVAPRRSAGRAPGGGAGAQRGGSGSPPTPQGSGVVRREEEL